MVDRKLPPARIYVSWRHEVWGYTPAMWATTWHEKRQQPDDAEFAHVPKGHVAIVVPEVEAKDWLQ